MVHQKNSVNMAGVCCGRPSNLYVLVASGRAVKMTRIRCMISELFVGLGHNWLQQVVEGNMVACFVGSKLDMQISVTMTCAARNQEQVLRRYMVQVAMFWDCMQISTVVLQY